MTVYNEWGRLREVFIGAPLKDRIGEWSPDYGRYVGFHSLKPLLTKHSGELYEDHIPDRVQRAIEQTDAYAKALEDYGIKVHRPRFLSEKEAGMLPLGFNQQSPRDMLAVIGKHIIETNMRTAFRNKEILGYQEFLRDYVDQHPEVQHVRMPFATPDIPGDTPEDWDNDPRPLLAGGDLFRFGKDILVGHATNDSSPGGIKWLQRYLGPEGYRVHEVPLDPKWIHLDCVLFILKEGLAVLHQEGLKGGLDAFPPFLRKWDFIPATEEEAKNLGCNGLCLEPGVAFMGAEHTRIRKEIEKRGVKVLAVPFDGPSYFGGGPRCASHELIRDE